MCPVLEIARVKGAIFAGLVMMLAWSLAPPVASAQVGDGAGEPRRVVILNATDPYLPAFLAVDGGVRAALQDTSRVATELFAETLDMYRFPRAQLDPDVVALLRKKYRDLEVDVVVAAGTTALDFALDNRPRIWPGASIVFHSVPTAALGDRSLDPRTIGVPVALEIGHTLDLALRLRPTTRQIAVIAGTAEPDIRHLELARAALGRYADRLEVRYLVGLTVAETVEAVRALPADAAVLYLTIFRDGAGAPQVPRYVLTRISALQIDEREVQVSVTDRGPGVPPDRVADIFEPLSSGTRGGMGMGLAISRAIIEAHAGRLWYEPNPAGGAVFRFTLRTAGA